MRGIIVIKLFLFSFVCVLNSFVLVIKLIELSAGRFRGRVKMSLRVVGKGGLC